MICGVLVNASEAGALEPGSTVVYAILFIKLICFKENLRTIEAQFLKDLRTTEAHFEFTGPYKKKRVMCQYLFSSIKQFVQLMRQ